MHCRRCVQRRCLVQADIGPRCQAKEQFIESAVNGAPAGKQYQDRVADWYRSGQDGPPPQA